ncbi:MAG: hypothetical protein ABIG71_01760 [Candidatus Uhrbacteria bacterium]
MQHLALPLTIVASWIGPALFTMLVGMTFSPDHPAQPYVVCIFGAIALIFAVIGTTEAFKRLAPTSAERMPAAAGGHGQ